MSNDTIIKTTARYQEANEPPRQKPIIQIDSDFASAGNRHSSIDSGRDNPFRPDGPIYKSADPIVDFYKYGPNHSRPHSPTDSQLAMLSGSQDGKAGGAKTKETKEQKRRRKRREKQEAKATGDQQKQSCWRRWLCCCCCRCCRRRSNKCQALEMPQDSGRLPALEAQAALIPTKDSNQTQSVASNYPTVDNHGQSLASKTNKRNPMANVGFSAPPTNIEDKETKATATKAKSTSQRCVIS